MTKVNKARNSTVSYVHKRLVEAARHQIQSGTCSKCGASKRTWKIIPIYEFGDPTYPSKVILYCHNCSHNEVFARVPEGTELNFVHTAIGEKKNEDEFADFKRVGSEAADELIKK